MRSTFAAAAAISLLALSPALAGSATLTDAAWDQFLVAPEENVAPFGTCRDAGTDLRAIEVVSSGSEIVVTLSVADLGSHHVTCDFFGSQPAVFQLWEARLRPVVESVCGEFTCTRSEVDAAVSFSASREGDASDGCAFLRFADGPRSGCFGAFESGTTTVAWRIPAAGSIVVQNGDTRVYELTGQSVVPEAAAAAFFDHDLGLGLGFGMLTLTDNSEASWEAEPTVL